jgi:hypothetical protein
LLLLCERIPEEEEYFFNFRNMDPFKNLSGKEYEMLLKFPAYITLLAANIDDRLDEEDKKSAIKYAHIKTFSSNPLLEEFYRDADKVFKDNLEELDKALPADRESREAAIKRELIKLDNILVKLGHIYGSTMHRSMVSFKEHVSKAHHNVLVDFVFPFPIKGLTDR